MNEPDFVLTDKYGRPIPSTAMTERMKGELQEFIAKHSSRIMAFWKRNGMGLRPPIKYNCDNQKWYWDEKEDR